MSIQSQFVMFPVKITLALSVMVAIIINIKTTTRRRQTMSHAQENIKIAIDFANKGMIADAIQSLTVAVRFAASQEDIKAIRVAKQKITHIEWYSSTAGASAERDVKSGRSTVVVVG